MLRALVAAMACTVVLGSIAAQDAGAPTVEGRLLQILRARGVITDAELVELQGLEANMRRDADFEHKIGVGVNEMTARLAEDAPNSASREYLLVLGYFWHQHDMELQFDFGRVENHFAPTLLGPNPSNVDEWRARMQFQLIF